jgi:hypothetical protein
MASVDKRALRRCLPACLRPPHHGKPMRRALWRHRKPSHPHPHRCRVPRQSLLRRQHLSQLRRCNAAIPSSVAIPNSAATGRNSVASLPRRRHRSLNARRNHAPSHRNLFRRLQYLRPKPSLQGLRSRRQHPMHRRPRHHSSPRHERHAATISNPVAASRTIGRRMATS